MRRRQGTRRRHLPASLARARAQAHPRRPALSGTVAPHRHDRRQLQRRRSRRTAPRRRHAPLLAAHEADLEVKLRAGMTANGISPQTQDEIVLAITSFALYGFPESHAASFALLAYASAYFKVPLPGRLHRGLAQQPAHGLLRAGHPRQRRPTPRPENAPRGRNPLRVALHVRSSTEYPVPSRQPGRWSFVPSLCSGQAKNGR